MTSAGRTVLSRFPGFRQLFQVYRRCVDAVEGDSFEARALKALDIHCCVDSSSIRQVPPTGPLIVAANHPTGIADGLVLIESIRRTRRDVRILANQLLAGIPELRDSCFFVDPFGSRSSANRSVAGLRAAHRWLRRGGAILLFPAGEVAWRKGFAAIRTGRTPIDSVWHPTLGHLALATRASIVPALVTGRNSLSFYAAGLFHPRVRTMLLGHELLKQRGTTFAIRFGRVLTHCDVDTASGPEQVTQLIRRELDVLSTEGGDCRSTAISPAERGDQRVREIASLPPEAKLLSSGAFDVYCIDSTRIPNVLDEIGRLRETTFREVGEGTGSARDIDRFDRHYQQLFVWDRVQSEIVGAYRVGATDRILQRGCVSDLYTSTLFRYDDRLLAKIGPALELGRSFVRREYQRSHSPLLLLWKGIGELVARSPRYRILFGAVSISNRYAERSRALLCTYLLQHHRSDLASFVQAINPPLGILRLGVDTSAVTRVDQLEDMVRGVEGERGIPVLLRHYLRLNAAVLGFNMDRSFGDALDALMMVDLASLASGRLRKYLGEHAQTFLEYHAAQRTAAERAA